MAIKITSVLQEGQFDEGTQQAWLGNLIEIFAFVAAGNDAWYAGAFLNDCW